MERRQLTDLWELPEWKALLKKIGLDTRPIKSLTLTVEEGSLPTVALVEFVSIEKSEEQQLYDEIRNLVGIDLSHLVGLIYVGNLKLARDLIAGGLSIQRIIKLQKEKVPCYYWHAIAKFVPKGESDVRSNDNSATEPTGDSPERLS